MFTNYITKRIIHKIDKALFAMPNHPCIMLVVDAIGLIAIVAVLAGAILQPVYNWLAFFIQ
jgi:hypothetical protein